MPTLTFYCKLSPYLQVSACALHVVDKNRSKNVNYTAELEVCFICSCEIDRTLRALILVFSLNAGINEVDGNEGMVILAVMVLQACYDRAGDNCTRYSWLAFQTKWSSSYQLHRLVNNFRICATVRGVECHV